MRKNIKPQSSWKLTPVSKKIKKIAMWLASIFLAALATYFSSKFLVIFDALLKPTKEWVIHFSCATKSAHLKLDDSRFHVLISPLNDDVDYLNTNRLISALTTEHFNVLRICESISLDTYLGTDAALIESRNKSVEVINKYGADLLIFGNVVKNGESIELWEVNSTGGCDTKPRHLILDHGFVQNESGLDVEVLGKLVAASVTELSAACKHDKNTDWNMVEERTKKVKKFLETQSFNLRDENIEDISGAYSDAMGLLYKYGNKLFWYETASAFNLDRANRVHINDPERQGLWLMAQGALVVNRWEKTKDEKYLLEAISYFTDSLKVRPSAYTYELRSDALYASKDVRAAIYDIRAAIRLDPSNNDLLKKLDKMEIEDRK